MTDMVRYTTGWNNLTNQPAADHDWIDASLARARFEQNEFIDVVESSSISKDGLVYPRWVMGVTAFRGVAGGARVEFYDPNGSCWRAVDYDCLKGRLWRSSVTDRQYPDGPSSPDALTSSLDTQRWKLSDSIRTTRITVRPDGAAHFKIRDRTTGEKSLTNLTGLDVSAHWLDIPTFGEWDALTDPGRSATEIAQGS